MKHKLLKLILSFILTILAIPALAIPALAAPADSTPWTFEQPDGTTVTFSTFGDEFFMWSETEDGYIIEFNHDTRTWYYAYIKDGELRAGDIAAGQILRSRSEAPKLLRDDIQNIIENIDREALSTYIPSLDTIWRSTSEDRVSITQVNNRQPLLVVLLEFSDRQFCDSYLTTQFPTTTSYWSNHFFGNEGRTVNEWFRENSGDFNLQFTQPDFLREDGFFIERPMAGVSSIRIQDGVALVRLEQNHPQGTNVRSALTLAFRALKPFIDFSDVPGAQTRVYNEDFHVYSVLAGYNRTSLTGAINIPSTTGHASPWSTMSGNRLKNVSFIPNTSFLLHTYGAQGELLDPGLSIGIGMAVHEIAHLLSVPDLYDYNRQHSLGVAYYSVMAQGMWGGRSFSPAHFGPWEKKALGFAEPTVVAIDDIVDAEIFNVSSHNSGEGYEFLKVISEINPYQYFLIENRQQAGFDVSLIETRFGLGDFRHGILIWHVDKGTFGSLPFTFNNWFRPNDNWMHRSVAVEGVEQWHFGASPFFEGGRRPFFNAETTPNSNFHEQGFCNFRLAPHNCHPQTVPSNVDVEVLSNSAPTMQVRIGGTAEPCPIVAEGRFADQAGIGGIRGATWTLCGCGVLTVGEGFIHWTLTSAGPWSTHRAAINEIVFTGPITAGTSLTNLFRDLSNVTTIEGLELFDTSNVTNMRSMFWDMRSLTTLDVYGWDTGKVTDMGWMFWNTNSLTALNVSNWNTGRVTNMSRMFGGMWSLTSLDMGNWNTSSVTNMSWMFENMLSLESIDVSNFDTSRVTDMSNMFLHMRSLTTLDVANFDTGRVTSMYGMFWGTSAMRSLTLGEDFAFRESPSGRVAALQMLGVSSESSGFWQNVGDGTIENPNGLHVLSSAQLAIRFCGATMANTWVWQPLISECLPVAWGRVSGQNAPTGLEPAPWTLCECGVVRVRTGFIDQVTHGMLSPWNAHRDNVTRIVIEDSIIAGRSLVNLFRNLSNVTAIEGLEHLETRNVIDMSHMFSGAHSLVTLDISSWDTSSVTTMSSMFFSARSLTTLDVSNWDISRVTDLHSVFNGARSLESLDLSNWDTRNLNPNRMGNAFSNMDALRFLSLGENFVLRGDPNLPAVRVTPESTGFWQNVGSGTLERPRGEHVLTSAQLMTQFNGATMADAWVWQPIISDCRIVAAERFPSQAGASGILGALWMLCECGVLTVSEGFIHQATTSVSPWSAHRTEINKIIFTGPITAGTSLFRLFQSLFNVKTIEGLEYFDTSNVIGMSGVFQGTNSLTSLDLSSWDTSSVTNMSGMFQSASSLTSLDLSGWNTGNVTNMNMMFFSTCSLVDLDVSTWDTSRVTDMRSMFTASSLTSLNLSSWDTRNVTQGLQNNMLQNMNELRVLTLGENFTLRGTNLPAIRVTSEFTGYWQNVGSGTPERPRGEYVLTSIQLMSQFNGATMADTWVWQPVGDWCPIVAEGRFADQRGGEELRGAPWELCECGILTVGEGFINWAVATSPWHVHRLAINEIIFTGPITAGTSLMSLFRDLSNVTSIEGLEYFDTSNVRSMWALFSNTNSVTTLDVSNWDTSSVTNTHGTFGARSLTDLDVSNWDTSNVTNMNSMFGSAASLTHLDLSRWDVSRVDNMDNMFSGARSLTSLDVSNWDTGNVRTMSSMFSQSGPLVNLDLSGFDTSNVWNMNRMFSSSDQITSLDLSSWNTSRVTEMTDMFSSMTNLVELNVSTWDTSNVRNMSNMFNGARSLTSLDLSTWDTNNATNRNNMFTLTSELRTLTLGESFRFGSGLPAIRTTPEFTGYWQNVGSGTPERPRGEYVLTSIQLMSQFNGATMADTWVWQPR